VPDSSESSYETIRDTASSLSDVLGYGGLGEEAERIDVVLPLRNEFAATLRTVAASLGADAGFSVDEIDDLRLGLSEVFSVLVDDERVAGPSTRVITSFHQRPGELAVTVGVPDSDVEVELDDLAANILGSVLDHFAVEPGRVVLMKRAAEVVGSRDV
jgi:hypothetical protein